MRFKPASFPRSKIEYSIALTYGERDKAAKAKQLEAGHVQKLLEREGELAAV